MVQLNSTTATANSLLAFQRSGTGLWRIGDVYNGGTNYFEVFNTVLNTTGLRMDAATNKTEFLAQENYTTGQAQGNLFTYNLTVPGGTTFTSPNAIHSVNSYLNLSLGGNTTTPAGTRQGLEGNSRISFTGAGTLTMTQGSTVRAWSSLSSVYSFNGSAVGTITHLAGLRVCFPDNTGSAVNITNNYGLLINNQTAGTGTINYTSRWGIYQEGASDLNYFNGNLLVKTTTNAGFDADINGTARVQGTTTITGSTTAASAIARGANITSTLVASANSDVLIGLDITPTFTNGAFTGVNNIGIRLSNVRGGFMWLGALQGNSGTGTQAYQFTTNDTTNVGTMIVSQRNASGSGTALFVQQLGTGLGLNVATGNTILGSATSTTHRLEVNGSGLFNGTLTGVPSLRVSGSITAASLAQGLFINPTLIASANNDALIGLDINPTFTNGAFTGVTNLGLRVTGAATFSSTVTTGAPTGGTAAAWRLGSRVAAAVALDATQYIELEVGGTLYKLAIVT
jgi:hypothetical protein